MEDWEAVPWGSKSFSPRRGRVWGVFGEVEWERERERAERRRKSWVSSVRSGSGGCGEGDGGREGEGGGEVIIAAGNGVLLALNVV